jgi:hypothetical protein
LSFVTSDIMHNDLAAINGHDDADGDFNYGRASVAARSSPAAALRVPEILDHVLSHLADDAPALRAASLVSRAWSLVALARLWRDGPADSLVRLFTIGDARRAHYAALLHSLTLKLRHVGKLAYVCTAGVTFPQLRALAIEFQLPYSAKDDHGVRQFIEHAVWDHSAGNSPLTSLSMSCLCARFGGSTLTVEFFALLAARFPRLTSLVLDGIYVRCVALESVAIECRRPDACIEVCCCRQQRLPSLQRLALGIQDNAAPALARTLPSTLTALNIQIGDHVHHLKHINLNPNADAMAQLGPLVTLGGLVDGDVSVGQSERNGSAVSHIVEAIPRRTAGLRELEVQWCHARIPLAAWGAFEQLLPRCQLAVLRLGRSVVCSTDHATVAALGFTDTLLERLLAGQPLLRQLSLALTTSLSPAALEVVGRSCRILEQLKLDGKFYL